MSALPRALRRIAIGSALLAGAGFAQAHAEDLSPAGVSGFDDAYVSASANFSSYSSVYVAPVETDIDLDDRPYYDRQEGFSAALTPDEVDNQADELRGLLERQIERHSSLASGPGAGVLVVEATLTELEPSRPTMEGMRREPSLSMTGSVNVGGAAVRIELLDGETDEVIARLEDRSFHGSLDDGDPRIGTWSDAEDAYRRWARSLAKYLSRELGAAS